MNRLRSFRELAADDVTALHPGRHHQERKQCDRDREPSARRELDDVRTNQKYVDHKEDEDHRPEPSSLPTPEPPRNDREEDRGDEHVKRDSNAVRARELRRTGEEKYCEEAADEHQAVQRWNVNLPLLLA